jgi:transposase
MNGAKHRVDVQVKHPFPRDTSWPGIAAGSAAMLVTEMPELGGLDSKQAASFAGLAPIARQSGHWKGKAFM